MKDVLLINPPVYDFTAYDFWLKPYGLLSVAGYLRGKANFQFFDYMDRLHPYVKDKFKSDKWGRGRYYAEKIPNPEPLKNIPRFFRRFGLPREIFKKFLQKQKKTDFVLIQTMMTYWYPGVKEVIEDVREHLPQAKIILGGPYAAICPEHAKTLGPDFLVDGIELTPLFDFMQINPDYNQPTLWEVYDELKTGVLKLTQGCAFNCSYCSVPMVYKKFKLRPFQRSMAELNRLIEMGVKNLNFYDDALLFKADQMLVPFLEQVISRNLNLNFHTPNALNARYITPTLAEVMVEAGFKTFFLGFESSSASWQKKTGGKVFSDELADAVKFLADAGADKKLMTAYQIIGHPDSDMQQLKSSMEFVNSLGIRGMLADFSPIPGTPDGEKCRQWIDLDEPLLHNKTAFPIIKHGFDEINEFKDYQRKLNRNLSKSK